MQADFLSLSYVGFCVVSEQQYHTALNTVLQVNLCSSAISSKSTAADRSVQ